MKWKLFGRASRTPAHTRRAFRPQLESLESRLVPYTTSGNAWPNPQLITLGFVPDGTIVGTSQTGYISSTLNTAFASKFGSTSAWQNAILLAAQTWAQQTNLNFSVISDSGATIGSGPDQQGDPNMGDIRVSGYNFGSNILAQAYMPPPVNNYSIAGDIKFNTGANFHVGATYDLTTVAIHELGHALGLAHSTVASADMYSAYGGTKNTLTTDDINGIQALYGGPRHHDAYYGYFGNGSFANATNINSLIDPASGTAVVNNADITTVGQQEYFVFTAPAGASSSMTVTMQSSGLSLLSPQVQVYNASQQLLGSASSTKYGDTISVTINNVVPGATYYIKASSPVTTPFGTGAYALTLNMGTGPNPTVPLPNTTLSDGNPISGGGGQLTTISQETLVNTFTTGTQTTSTSDQQNVAVDANGNSVVVWSSQNQDGTGWGVYAQRFDSSGNPTSGEFRVNTTTQDDQTNPAVAMDSNGDFVVTWASNNQDGSGWGIYGQRYDSSGNPTSGEFRVNTTTQDDQTNPAVAMDANGDFVITWASHNQDGSGWGVFAQRYGSSGNPVGSEFRANTTTQDDQTNPAVAMDANGDFVITWASHNQDGSGWGIYAQRYNLLGLPQSSEFRVNTTTQDDQTNPAVAMDRNGDFVITWASHNQDGSGWGIYGQQYNLQGIPHLNLPHLGLPQLGPPQSGEFRVNTYTLGDQTNPSVAMNPAGGFDVTWASNGQDGSGWGVYAAQFGSTGTNLGSDVLVNTTTANNQQYSSVAVSSGGRMTIAWSGSGTGDTSGVFLQLFDTLNSSEAISDTFDPNEKNNGVSVVPTSGPAAPPLGSAVAAAPVIGPGSPPAAPQGGALPLAQLNPFVSPLLYAIEPPTTAMPAIWPAAPPAAQTTSVAPFLLASTGPLGARPAGFSDTLAGADSASSADESSEAPTAAPGAGAPGSTSGDAMDTEVTQGDEAVALDVLDGCFLDPAWMDGDDHG